MSKLARKPLKRVALIMGMDDKGRPMAITLRANELRRIYLEDDGVHVESTVADEKVNTFYPKDKFMAVEYVVQDSAIVLDLKAEVFGKPEKTTTRFQPKAIDVS